MNPKLKVPFNADGDMLHYHSCMASTLAAPWPHQTYLWADNHFWAGNLTYVGFEKGRSRVTIHFADDNDRRFCMTLAAFTDCIPYMDRGVISGVFYFGKQGTTYTVLLKSTVVGDEPPFTINKEDYDE
jgi:hypothetical protein